MTDTQYITKKINDDYSHGNYGGLEVVFRTTGEFSGYINVTQLFKTSGQTFDHWKGKSDSKNRRTIEFHSEKMGKPSTTYEPSKKIEFIQGTYTCKFLAVQIAQHISFEFGWKVSEIFNTYAQAEDSKRISLLDNEINRQNRLLKKRKKMLSEKDDIIVEKEDSITALRREMAEYRKEQQARDEQAKKELEQTKKEQQARDEQAKKGKIKLLDTVKEVQKTVEKIEDKFNKSVIDRVPDTNNELRLRNICVVMKNYKEDQETDDDGDELFNYKVFRVQQRSIAQTIRKHKLRFPEATEIYRERSPNVVNAINRLKQREEIIFKRRSSNYFNIEEINIEEFKEIMEEVLVIEKANVR